jgi:hypothetical protein
MRGIGTWSCCLCDSLCSLALLLRQISAHSQGVHALLVVRIRPELMPTRRRMSLAPAPIDAELTALARGRALVSGGDDGHVRSWNLADMTCTADANIGLGIVTCLSECGPWVLCGTHSRIIVLHQGTLEIVSVLEGPQHWVRTILGDPATCTVFSGSHNLVHVWTWDDDPSKYIKQEDSLGPSPLTLRNECRAGFGSVFSLALTSSLLIVGTYNQVC